jgi:predicted HD phosphohydrolase
VLHALRPRIDGDELSQARELLSEHESRLFFAMERRDQRHALEVMRRLRESTEDRPILAAALLHDCGKGSVPVWLRVLNVLAPALVQGLSRAGSGAAYRLRHHAELGATMAEAAGSSPTTVRLIRGHIEPDEAWMHELLIAADDAS